MNKYFHLCWILGAFLLLPSISLAQDRPGERVFANVSDEIKHYVVNDDYTLRHYDVLSIDQQAVERARFLSRNHEKLFIEASKEYLLNADARETSRLIWIYLLISTPDHRPLVALISPDSFETTFKNAQEIRAALADLDAKSELATYLQQKALEDLCIAKGYEVRNGVPITAITHKFPVAAQRNTKYAQYFEGLLQSIVWKPDEQALARYAVERQSERLRGYAVLLSSHYKSETALNVILDRLENDRSSLVVGWAAIATVTNPTSRVVDTLIAVYDRSEDAGIRFNCTEALGMIGGEKAILTLRKALNDVNPQVREMAKFRLGQLAERND